MDIAIYIGFLLEFVGIIGTVLRKNLVMKLLSLGISDIGVILIFIAIGYLPGGGSPIIRENMERYVDPLPQALVITSIVIGFATLSLSLVFVMYLSNRFHTVDSTKLERRVKDARDDP